MCGHSEEVLTAFVKSTQVPFENLIVNVQSLHFADAVYH